MSAAAERKRKERAKMTDEDRAKRRAQGRERYARKTKPLLINLDDDESASSLLNNQTQKAEKFSHLSTAKNFKVSSSAERTRKLRAKMTDEDRAKRAARERERYAAKRAVYKERYARKAKQKRLLINLDDESASSLLNNQTQKAENNGLTNVNDSGINLGFCQLSTVSMQPRFFCSKCRQCSFMTINDLENHIVKRHFYNNNALYKCWFANCSKLFPTEVTRLQHMHLDKLHADHIPLLDINRQTFMQKPDEDFVSRRLAINCCLNESINLSFSRLSEMNGNNSGGPTPIESSEMRLIGMASAGLQGTAATPSEPRRQTQQNFYDSNEAGEKRIMPQTSSRATINPDRFYQPESVTCSIKDEPIPIHESAAATATLPNPNGSFISNIESAAQKPKRSRKQNFADPDPGPSNNHISLSNNVYAIATSAGIAEYSERAKAWYESTVLSPNSKFKKQNISYVNDDDDKRTQPQISSSLSVIKDEPSLIDKLAADIPAPSNYDDDLSLNYPLDELRLFGRPKKSNLTTAEKEAIIKAKIENKPRVVKKILTRLQISSVVKEKPSLIDELAADIPLDHCDYLRHANNAINSDSDDEIRIRKKLGRKKKTTPEIEQFIVNASANDVCLSVSDAVIAVKKKFGVQIGYEIVRNIRQQNGICGFNFLKGAAQQRSAAGRKKKTTPEIEQFIMNVSQNDVWLSVSEVAIAVKKKFGVQIGDGIVRKIRHKNGIFGVRPKS